MKRAGSLWPAITSFENLLLAARKAQRAKRFKPNVARFNFNLENELVELRRELLDRRYRPGAYRQFEIRDPKRRVISAAPYRDRVVHHALCNVIETIFDRSFIHDSYACRRAKGTHAAANRVQHFARRFCHALKCDVSRYFPSIDHACLKAILRQRVKDESALWLIDLIVDSGADGRASALDFEADGLFAAQASPRGIPIGNLTSQFFANVYLNPFDHFVKECLRFQGYVRYVDDFVLFHDDKGALHAALDACVEYLAGLRLRLNPRKCRVFPVRDGVDFVGYRIFPHCRRLRAANLRRLRKRLRALQQAYRDGDIGLPDVRASIQSWIAHAAHANSLGLRRDIFRQFTL